MKKTVFFAWALCAAWGVAQAQTDVTETYFTNPSFETLQDATGGTVEVGNNLEKGLKEWEIPKLKENTYSKFRVESEESGSSTSFGSNASIKPSDGTYYYFNSQNWMYGSEESEIKTKSSMPLEAGTYYLTIDYKAADASNNNKDENGTSLGIKVLKTGTTEVLGENAAVRRAHGLVNEGGDATGDSHMQDADWDKMGVMFTIAEASGIDITITQTLKSRAHSDVAYDNLRLYSIDMDNVSEASPLDLSWLISRDDGNLGGWKIDGGNTFHVNTWSSEGDTDGSKMTTPFIEDWVANGSILGNATMSWRLEHQVPGIYEAGALVRVVAEAGGVTPAGASLYANDATADVCGGTACTNGNYGTYTVKAVVGDDGVLEFGFRVTDANFNWLAFKDVTLKYLGKADTEALQSEVEALKLKVEEYAGKATTAGATALAAKLTEAVTKATEAGEDADKLSAALGALREAETLAESALPAAEELAAKIKECEEAYGYSEAEKGTKTTFNDAITTAKNTLSTGDTAEALAEAAGTLEQARQTYVKAAAPGKDHPFDFSFLATPSYTGMETGNKPDDHGWKASWTSETTPQNFRFNDNNAPDKGDLKHKGYIEAWNGSKYTGSFTYQLTGLPTGRYKISAYAFTRGADTWFTANTKEVQLDGTDDKYTNPTIDSIEVSDGTLTFGLRTQGSGEGDQWVGITNIQLQYLAASTEVTLNIKAADKWATLILPFDAEEIPEGLEVYSCDGVQENELKLTKETTITANTPYIVYAENGIDNHKFSGLSTADKDTYGTTYMMGTFVETDAPNGSYVLQNGKSGVAFYKVGDKQPKVKAYHAYLNEGVVTVGTNVQVLKFPTRDLPSHVAAATAEAATVDVYSVSGILVRSKVQAGKALEGLPKGIYVVNGEKKAVK